MSQISKCPKVTVVLTYWEALGDVSELRYKSLLCFSSKRSYCSGASDKYQVWLGLLVTLSLGLFDFSPECVNKLGGETTI